MADVILFRPNEKVVKGSHTKIGNPGRRGGAIGRPRARQPRIVPVWLEPAEIQQLNAKPIAALPVSKAEAAIPPFQRLSLAKRIEITYAKQRPRASIAVLDHKDRMVHSEQVLNWRVEVWQTGETRGTEAPRYFYRTECLTVGAVGGSKGKSRLQYSTPQRCLEAGRYKVRERESLWRERGRPTTRRRRVYKFRLYARRVSLPAELADLDRPLTVSELIGDVALCPVCRKLIDRNRPALSDHFETHVSKGLLKSREVDELLSFLVTPRGEVSVAAYA